jgi:hypothetical protein
MCTAHELTEQVRDFQRRTGEDSLLVIVNDGESITGIHHVGLEPTVGLLVDGRPPSVAWYQNLDSFHVLTSRPAILH